MGQTRQVVFQATRITQTSSGESTVVKVSTATEDPRITSQINQIVQREPYNKEEIQLTFRQRSYPVALTSVEETIDPLGNDSVVVECERTKRRSHQQFSPIRMLGGGMSAGSKHYEQKDLAQLALRHLVLNEDPPQDASFARNVPSLNFQALYEKYGDDPEVFVNLVRLLIVEAVIEHGLVEQLVRVDTEELQGGGMHVELSGVLSQQFTGAQPESVEVEGEIDFF